jgi:hypothetical protein
VDQVRAAVADADGDGHLQNLARLLADVAQHVDEAGLGVLPVDGGDHRHAGLRSQIGGEQGETAVVLQLFFHDLHDGDGDQIGLLVQGKFLALLLLRRFDIDDRGHPFLGSRDGNIIL